MKVLLDIKDKKAAALLDILTSLPYVKVETLSDEKIQLIKEVKEAVKNLKKVRDGKMKAKPIKELLDEL